MARIGAYIRVTSQDILSGHGLDIFHYILQSFSSVCLLHKDKHTHTHTLSETGHTACWILHIVCDHAHQMYIKENGSYPFFIVSLSKQKKRQATEI